jgi:hypothetical protein
MQHHTAMAPSCHYRQGHLPISLALLLLIFFFTLYRISNPVSSQGLHSGFNVPLSACADGRGFVCCAIYKNNFELCSIYC